VFLNNLFALDGYYFTSGKIGDRSGRCFVSLLDSRWWRVLEYRRTGRDTCSVYKCRYYAGVWWWLRVKLGCHDPDGVQCKWIVLGSEVLK